MIVDGERIRLLKTNSLFKGVAETTLKPYLKPKYFFEVKEGEIIYTGGDGSAELYLIVEGEVKIKSSDSRDVKHKYLSDFFGEEEIIKGGERTSCAVANTNCVLFKINSSEFKTLSTIESKILENINSREKEEPAAQQNFVPPKYTPPVDSSNQSGNDIIETPDDDVQWKIDES